MNELSKALREQLTASGKSAHFLSEYTGIDRAYIGKLLKGEKDNPSLDVLIRLHLALIACPEAFKNNPTMPFWLAELLTAAGYHAAARSK